MICETNMVQMNSDEQFFCEKYLTARLSRASGHDKSWMKIQGAKLHTNKSLASIIWGSINILGVTVH